MDKLPIDRKTAISRAVRAHMQAKREHDTAVSTQQKADARKKMDHWHGILQKVSTMDESKTYSQFLVELKKTTLKSYIDKAHPEAVHYDQAAWDRRVKLIKKHGNLHKPDRKLQDLNRKASNRTYGVNRAAEKLTEEVKSPAWKELEDKHAHHEARLHRINQRIDSMKDDETNDAQTKEKRYQIMKQKQTTLKKMTNLKKAIRHQEQLHGVNKESD